MFPAIGLALLGCLGLLAALSIDILLNGIRASFSAV
jgi:hypothetical protein